MIRIPYEVVAIEANSLIVKMSITSSLEKIQYYWNLYVAYIESCGWTDQEYDKETLKRINQDWQQKQN